MSSWFQVHNMNGVKKLLLLLRNDSEEVQYAAAGALRNVVYTNQENKTDVKNEKGLDVILDTLQNTSEKEIKHQLAGQVLEYFVPTNWVEMCHHPN